MSNKTAGFSIIEMMVGIAIGLIVVTTAIVMLVSTLKAQKDITASAKLNQELGAVMAVMSNEIRRAGFRICDADTFDCPPINDPPTEGSFITYEYDEVIEIGDVDGAAPNDGDCILYRYNANVDALDDVVEHRGFRLNGDLNLIEMAATTGAVTCDNDANWIPFTDPTVIDVTGLSFSTTGSKCRNMEIESKNWYWVVVGANETRLACELDDPATSPIVCTSLTTGVPCDSLLVETDDDIFATHQITIRVEAELSRDPAVTKILQSSVKVANPWVGKKAP